MNELINQIAQHAGNFFGVEWGGGYHEPTNPLENFFRIDFENLTLTRESMNCIFYVNADITGVLIIHMNNDLASLSSIVDSVPQYLYDAMMTIPQLRGVSLQSIDMIQPGEIAQLVFSYTIIYSGTP